MKIIKSVLYSIIPLIVLICISEVTLNIYSYSRDLDNPHLGFPFNVFRKYFKEDDLGNNTKNYRIPWDYKTNKMRPGNYTTEKGINYHINKMGAFWDYNHSFRRLCCWSFYLFLILIISN